MAMLLVCCTISVCSVHSILPIKNNIRAIPTNRTRKVTGGFAINTGKALFSVEGSRLPNVFRIDPVIGRANTKAHEDPTEGWTEERKMFEADKLLNTLDRAMA